MALKSTTEVVIYFFYFEAVIPLQSVLISKKDSLCKKGKYVTLENAKSYQIHKPQFSKQILANFQNVFILGCLSLVIKYP